MQMPSGSGPVLLLALAPPLCRLPFHRLHPKLRLGPTDAPLLARWAKILAMIQVFISLSIVVLLISRAVGAL